MDPIKVSSFFSFKEPCKLTIGSQRKHLQEASTRKVGEERGGNNHINNNTIFSSATHEKLTTALLASPKYQTLVTEVVPKLGC